jgi:hypothetical protein
MKRRAFGAAVVAALIGALTGSIALADNPHGTPPGQAKQDQSAAASQSAQANSSSTTSVSASTSSTQSNSAPQPSGKFGGCTGSSAQSDGTGVKPSNDTKKWTCATAGSADTKEYGNGKTAGGIAMSRGASASTMIYGPGNSQPHKVATCPDKNGKVHYKDVHAVKSYSTTGCASSSTSGTSSSNSSSNTTATTSNNTSMSNNTSVTNNSSVTNNTSVTNNAGVTNNASTTNGATAANTPSGTMGSTSPSTTSGVKGATHSSSPANATSPAKATSPASTRSPSKVGTPAKGVLGTTTKRNNLPFTGFPLWLSALASLSLLGAGLGLRRLGRSQA